MFDLISKAYAAAPDVVEAAEAVAMPEPTVQGEIMKFLPLALIFLVFYFLLIRPQQKKIDDQQKLLAALKKGDQVYLGSGLMGTVAKLVDDEVVMIEIAKGVQIKVLRSYITGRVQDKRDAANEK